MKVDVIHVSEASFRRFSWYSDWVDVAVYDYECRPWLIQMSISRTNKKRFRSVSISGMLYKQVSVSQVGSLTQMKFEDWK